MLLSWALRAWRQVAATRRMRFQRWCDELPRECGAQVCSLLPCLMPQCRSASPMLSGLHWLLSSPLALQGSCTGMVSLCFHGLPRGMLCTRELRGVLPPASFHRLPQPWEGIILCLTCYPESALSSGQTKDKMPTESSHSVQTKQHKCCCKGCKWGKRFLISF